MKSIGAFVVPVALSLFVACAGADPGALVEPGGGASGAAADGGAGSGGSLGTPSGGGSSSGAGSSSGGSSGGGGSSSGGSSGGGGSSSGGGSSGDAGPVTPPAGNGTGRGYLHTKGGQIVDESGAPIRLTGVSWFGMETSNFAPHGLWTRSLASMLDQMKSLGFNSVRVPWTNQMLDAGSTPNGIDFGKNPDLQNLTPIQILDKVIDAAEQRGLRVILDRHRPDASGQSPLWYTQGTSEQRWIDDWKAMAVRYKGRSTVIGFDLHNEPHGDATWGDGNQATDWRLAAERAGNAVQEVNPDLLIIVEGVQNNGGASYWWGGNLRGAAAAPVRLNVPNHLVYSPHDYPASVSAQTWFSDPKYPANLPSVWDASWGYLARTGQAPVWVGEFGTKNQTQVDQQWFKGMVDYVKQSGISFAFWCWNPDSGDTGGVLQDDWTTVNTDKMTTLAPALAPIAK